MVNKKNEENKIKYTCPMCLKEFGNRKDNYQSHITKISGCGAGIAKLEEMKIENDKINMNILRLKEENEKLVEKNEKLVEEDKKIKEENDKLKEENENLKKQAIIYNNCNNTYNNFILQINNFDNTKCEVFIKNLLKYMGKSIYVKTVEDIYLNNEKPENHNIYVADKNRQIVKIFNNGIWQSKNMIVIDKIIDNIVKQFNISIEEIKKDKEKYERLKERITSKMNYINYCDTDYVEDLEEFPLDNKERIQRCKDFRDLVFDEIKTLLHDNKGKVLDTHKQVKQTKIKV
jgi:predicted nuclease with TOPRIM domain